MLPAAEDLKRLGVLFVEKGLVSEAALEEALEVQRRDGGRLGEILVARGAISRLDLANALSTQWFTSASAHDSRQEREFQFMPPVSPLDTGDALVNDVVGEEESAPLETSRNEYEAQPEGSGDNQGKPSAPEQPLLSLATATEAASDATSADTPATALPVPVLARAVSELPARGTKLPEAAHFDEALQIVRRRYALGELDRDQYLELISDLAV